MDCEGRFREYLVEIKRGRLDLSAPGLWLSSIGLLITRQFKYQQRIFEAGYGFRVKGGSTNETEINCMGFEKGRLGLFCGEVD